MELRHLEYFVAVASDLSFSRAAERIHVVQSALSASVGRLEKELGVDLFDRSKRQITLTAAGETFLTHAREVIHTAHRARVSVDAFRDQLAGTVTLGTLMSWGTLNLPAALEQFRRSHPLVTVRLRQSMTGSAGHLNAIADGHMDVALVSTTAPGSRVVRLRELMREPMVFVCEASHPLADRRRVELTDLAGHEFISFPQGWGIRRPPGRGFRRGRCPTYQRIRGRGLRDHCRTHSVSAGGDDRARRCGKPFPRSAHNNAAAGHDLDTVHCVGVVTGRQP
jgi:DNA-binding transcriptional LysR family regulator